MTARTSPTVRKRTELRRELSAERRKRSRGPGRSVTSFASPHSLRLDMHPASVIDHRRVSSVLGVVRRSGVAPYLDRRLRQHPGKRCSYAPEMLCVGTILSVLNGWTLELTDVTRALAAIPPITRKRLGLHDEDGYFIGYRSVDHQFNRLVKALDEGWNDPDGTHCDLDWLVDALIRASIPDDNPPVEAVALDGMAVESFSYMRWPRRLDPTLLEGLLDDDEESTPVASAESLGADGGGDDVHPAVAEKAKLTAKERAALRKAARFPWPEALVDRRPVPSKDPDARQGKRTVTNAQPLEFYLGYELHLASSVRSATWNGDPTSITFGPEVSRFVTGMRLSRAGAYRGDPGLELVRSMKAEHPALRELIADLGYTNLTDTPFNDEVRALGIDLVMNMHPARLTPARGKDIPVGRGGSKGTQKVVTAAGSLFHEFMPERYYENPPLPPRGHERREEVERYYNERAAYLWRHHGYGPNGVVRLRCPACAGRLRPLDLTRAARAGLLEMPELEAPAGVTACCSHSVISTTPEQRGAFYQSPPLFTTAWVRSYRRRLNSETANSVLRSGLARLVRGYFRVFTLPKVAFVIGMALVALNVKTVEQEWLDEHVEVTDLSDDAMPDADLGDDGMYSRAAAGDGDEVEEVATPPPEP